MVFTITLIELDQPTNRWFREYAVLIDVGKAQKHILVNYPDWDCIYGDYRIYQFYFN